MPFIAGALRGPCRRVLLRSSSHAPPRALHKWRQPGEHRCICEFSPISPISWLDIRWTTWFNLMTSWRCSSNMLCHIAGQHDHHAMHRQVQKTCDGCACCRWWCRSCIARCRCRCGCWEVLSVWSPDGPHMHQWQAQFDGAMRPVHLVVPLELCRRDGYRELAWVELQALQVEIGSSRVQYDGISGLI